MDFRNRGIKQGLADNDPIDSAMFFLSQRMCYLSARSQMSRTIGLVAKSNSQCIVRCGFKDTPGVNEDVGHGGRCNRRASGKPGQPLKLFRPENPHWICWPSDAAQSNHPDTQ